jgi:hypothetical protein
MAETASAGQSLVCQERVGNVLDREPILGVIRDHCGRLWQIRTPYTGGAPVALVGDIKERRARHLSYVTGNLS